MSIWRLSAPALGFAVLLGFSGAGANNLRGQIRQPGPIGASGWLPVAGVTVQLTKQVQNGLSPVDETQSISDGYFFFFKVAPGDYVLAVEAPSHEKLQFPLHVNGNDEQDIPPVMIK